MRERQVLGDVSPFFIVRDVRAALAFYEGLGFEVRTLVPDDAPFFAIVGRDRVQIYLKEISEDVGPIPNHTRHEWAPWDAFVFVDDSDALADEFESRGVSFHRPIGDRDDGLRGFELADHDGYVLFFGCPT